MSVRTGLRPRTGPEKATDGADGSGYADHPPGFLPLTWRFRIPARYRHPLIAGLGTGLSVLAAEGVGLSACSRGPDSIRLPARPRRPARPHDPRRDPPSDGLDLAINGTFTEHAGAQPVAETGGSAAAALSATSGQSAICMGTQGAISPARPSTPGGTRGECTPRGGASQSVRSQPGPASRNPSGQS
jgi:hypothetical protein